MEGTGQQRSWNDHRISRLTLIDPRVIRAPLHIAGRIDAVIEVAVGEDTAVQGVPWSTEIALVCDFE